MEKNKRMQFYGGTLGACAPLLVFMCLMIVIAAMKKVSLVLFCMAGFAGLCVAFLLAKNKKEFEQAVVDGLKNDTLCVIIFAFLLAGILSQELRQSGLIQGLTWLVMKLGLSAGFLPLVAFLVCLLISTACGTSNGAIVAVLPVLLPVAATVGANPSVVVGAIVSGAIFGDNLAPISDTTIASALTQDAEVRDVVRTRLPYSLIAGVISAVLFIIVGIKTSTSVTLPDVIDPAYAKTLVMLIIPVIMIILMLRGWNLISTLIVCDLVGFVLCLVFGFLDVPTLFSATGPIGAGLTGMLNVICFSFFMFALLEMLKRSGVFDMLLEKLNNAASGRARHYPAERHRQRGHRRRVHLDPVRRPGRAQAPADAQHRAHPWLEPHGRHLHRPCRHRAVQPRWSQRRQPCDRERRCLGVVLVPRLCAV